MNPEIKKLMKELRECAAFDVGLGESEWATVLSHPATLAASILQAVFDPENQPSQYGTTLLQK